ncbi:MAG: thiamine pyrophosphate-dependent enzyme [Desulfobacteraceae bacterium]
MSWTEIVLGNGAIALGLVESGVEVMTSYPGTPSSEILPEVVRRVKQWGLGAYTEWSTNEKVAFDNAFAAAISGKRAACSMKQVGLNVAADSLMSAAYLGCVGGLLVISADDPGPHSSQTEQDTRFMARLAKVPVLDPSTPKEARSMVHYGMALSEEFEIPVVLRPAIRVCHARQSLEVEEVKASSREAAFNKDPFRWAATPRYRYVLHGELNRKLRLIGERFSSEEFPFNRHDLEAGRRYPLGVIAGGVPWAVVRDTFREEGREGEIPVLKLGGGWPFPDALVKRFMDACDKILVVEETDTLIEYQLGERGKVFGRLSGHVPSEGELVPEVIYDILDRVLEEAGLERLGGGKEYMESRELVKGLELPVRRPTLCPGCTHRASFYSIRRVKPKAIFTSDIGCYTLGLNLGGVDTVLDMGAAVTMASGFYHAYEKNGVHQSIIATIGDSTFYHSGTAGLLNSVYNDARFVLVILDNQTTAMTGMQPTPGLGVRADGSEGKAITLERAVAGCGVDFIEEVDPYDMGRMQEVLKRALAYTEEPEGGIAVVIARHPCVIAYPEEALPERVKVKVTEDCDDCGLCIQRFECPALYRNEELGRTEIDRQICVGCGLCIEVCPRGAIVKED